VKQGEWKYEEMRKRGWSQNAGGGKFRNEPKRTRETAHGTKPEEGKVELRVLGANTFAGGNVKEEMVLVKGGKKTRKKGI